MKSNRGFALMVFGVMAIPVIGMVGLGIDTGVMYVIKGKLSAAVDAGALAGARALSRGNDDAAQRDRAQQVASGYVRANFPAGYLMSRNLNIPLPTVDINIANQRSVTLEATVDAPTFFMKIFGNNGNQVRAGAVAVRRDVNVMLVLDRSGSLQNSGSCDDLRAAATGFVNKFAPGRDNLGLVTYATSSFLEFAMGNNFATANPTMETIINRIVCTGGTASSDGLSRGYWHLAGLNQPAALNVLLFFTDGQPTALTANFQRANGSPCNNNQFTGVWTVAGTPPNSVWGLLNPSAGPSPVPNNDLQVAPQGTGCRFANNWSNNHADTSDYLYIPDLDVWGNNLNSGYQNVSRTEIAGQQRIRPIASNGIPVATNAADDAARRIRQGAAMNGRTLPNVVIFGIGLGNAPQAANNEFMLRVTNDPRSPTYNSDEREGLYVYAPTAADLNDAFTRLASEILRLSR